MLETTHINPALTEFGHKFTQLEPDSVTIEEGDLLYALVRMRKPQLAVETGTGHAIATRRIGEALRDNREGFLLSCDTEPDYVRDAKVAAEGLPVDIRCTTGLETLKSFDGRQAEFIFIDAGTVDNRAKELSLIVEKNLIPSKGLLITHDALNPNYQQMINMLRDFKYRLNWQMLTFESLAGIAVLQRP